MNPLFYELHLGLPRHVPGGREFTLRALSMVPDLPLRPRIADLGCGLGAQTVDLLTAIEGSSAVAVDRSAVFLEALRGRAEQAGVLDRTTLVEGDPAAPPASVHPASFHLVWSEGATPVVGFDSGLRAWRHLLLPGGFIAVSEMIWRAKKEDAPEEARSFFSEVYPSMRDNDTNCAAFEDCGFELSGNFVLPSNAWWASYYTPLLERLATFEAQHGSDESAQAVVAKTKHEIELFRQHGDSYGYAFYVGRMR